MQHELNLPAAMSEHEYLKHIKEISLKNKVYKNYIGQGYYDTITPSVILRNVFENRDGTHNTLLTRQKYHRDDWKVC